MNRARVRWIRAADRFLGGVLISSLYRRFIVAFLGPWIVDISAIFELNATLLFIGHMVVLVCARARGGLRPKGSHVQGTRHQQGARHGGPAASLVTARQFPMAAFPLEGGGAWRVASNGMRTAMAVQRAPRARVDGQFLCKAESYTWHEVGMGDVAIS